MSSLVYDTSAILAYLQLERGWEIVNAALMGAGYMSDVNLGELVAKLAEAGMSRNEIEETIDRLNLTFVAFDSESAYLTGLLRPATKSIGLSLGDRACLALGIQQRSPVLTADRAWRRVPLDVDVQIEFIR